MGKKGKKKGGNEERNTDAGPSQGAPVQQQQQSQQQTQQQQRAPPMTQASAASSQQGTGPAAQRGGDRHQGLHQDGGRDGGPGREDGRGRGRGGEGGGRGRGGEGGGRGRGGEGGGRGRGEEGGGRGRGGEGGGRGRGEGGGRGRGEGGGRGRGGDGRGRGGDGVGRGRGGEGRGRGESGGIGRGGPPGTLQGQPPAQRYVPGIQQQGPPVQQYVPGIQQQGPPVQRYVPGIQQQGPPVQRYVPGIQQQGPPVQRYVPGIQQGQAQQQGRGGQGRGGQGHGGQGRGDPGPQSYGPRDSTREQQGSRQSSAPSPARSVSSGQGDTGSGGSGKGSSKGPAGTGPVKTSIPKAEQERLISLIPKRKNPSKGGTAGRRITVETNMIPIVFGKNFTNTMVHYDVKIEPDKPKFMYRPIMEAVRLKHYRNNYPGFDGRCNLFAAGTLPFGDNLETEITVLNRERQSESTFKVSLTRAQDIDTSWLRNVRPGFCETEREQIAIQAVDVILRSVAIRRQAITVGRSLFFEPEPGRVLDLGNGMDLWVGTFQSVILGWKPYFNVDVAHKGFPRSQPVLQLIEELCGTLTPRDVEYGRRKIQSYLKGLKVTYEIPGHPGSKRTWGINDLARSARESTFELNDGSVSTIENYFAREKRYKIRYPDLPTLWVGSRQKQIYVPAELCTIEVGQVTNKKLDERQTSSMVRAAATNTATRRQKIMDGFSKMRFNNDPAMAEFGISVNAGFETVNARVLDPPSLTDKREIVPRKGVWRSNGFKTAMVLPDKSWTILNLNYRTQDHPLREFVKTLKNAASGLNMTIGEPTTPFMKIESRSPDVRQIINFFRQKKEEGLKLVVVVVPDRTGPEYGRIKQVAELNVGVLTQCIKAVTIERKMNMMTAGNILLKLHAKLNGTNQIFTPGRLPPCLQRPCMIVGADVTHPSPDATDIPSIAAVAASCNPSAFRYNVEIRLQPPRTEIILNLQEIIIKQLTYFWTETKGQKPEHIIFYRDGVSEGQFPQVMHHELQAIRNACKIKGGAERYEPAITFLVVQKRHHIRMFPTDQRNSDDKNGNVQAGTVVDTDITHPSHIDFYLVSHASIQGTARPTKYRCLWNDNDMSEDEIEQLTYYLCHMFSRCTRSVSYPAPTYYAHLAAFRARALTNEVNIHLNNLEQEQRTKMTIKSEILEGHPMFFV